MITANISELLGFECHYLNDEGTVACITTPFLFEDGDSIPLYVEQVGSKLRFFDDGGVISQFESLGIQMDDWADCQFVEGLAKPYGLTLNDEGELEIWTDAARSPAAFARYISAMFAMVRWEQQYNAIRLECRRQRDADGTVSDQLLSALENLLHPRPAQAERIRHAGAEQGPQVEPERIGHVGA